MPNGAEFAPANVQAQEDRTPPVPIQAVTIRLDIHDLALKPGDDCRCRFSQPGIQMNLDAVRKTFADWGPSYDATHLPNVLARRYWMGIIVLAETTKARQADRS